MQETSPPSIGWLIPLGKEIEETAESAALWQVSQSTTPPTLTGCAGRPGALPSRPCKERNPVPEWQTEHTGGITPSTFQWEKESEAAFEWPERAHAAIYSPCRI